MLLHLKVSLVNVHLVPAVSAHQEQHGPLLPCSVQDVDVDKPVTHGLGNRRC